MIYAYKQYALINAPVRYITVDSFDVWQKHDINIIYIYPVAMWSLRIYAFHKLTIALWARSAISCGQQCYIMQPRMLYHAAKNAISVSVRTWSQQSCLYFPIAKSRHR